MSFYYILLYMASGGAFWRRVLSLTGLVRVAGKRGAEALKAEQ